MQAAYRLRTNTGRELIANGRPTVCPAACCSGSDTPREAIGDFRHRGPTIKRRPELIALQLMQDHLPLPLKGGQAGTFTWLAVWLAGKRVENLSFTLR